VRRDSIFSDSASPGPNATPPPLQADELERSLQALSSDEREAIVLKIYNDFTFQQIADLRQVPLSTVATWYRRGLDQLRSRLCKEQI
jgi:RNA polymerase sigma-70 factor (ECF subfamily)